MKAIHFYERVDYSLEANFTMTFKDPHHYIKNLYNHFVPWFQIASIHCFFAAIQKTLTPIQANSLGEIVIICIRITCIFKI